MQGGSDDTSYKCYKSYARERMVGDGIDGAVVGVPVKFKTARDLKKKTH